VVVSTSRGQVTVRAKITATLPAGLVNIFHGWTEIELNRMIDPDYLDPISGFPGFKSLLCQVHKAGAEEGAS
jgi:formylmethanofuran dehydrogenase subunit D